MLHGISDSAGLVSREVPGSDSTAYNVADDSPVRRLKQSPESSYRETSASPLSTREVSSLESTRQEKINQCVNDLKQTFPMPEIDSGRKLNNHFWYSNDIDINIDHTNFQSMQESMEEKTPNLSHTPRVAMLVGESFLLPILPELGKHCDVVMMTDHDLALLQTQLKRIELMTNCESFLDEKTFEVKIHNYIAQSFGGKKHRLRDEFFGAKGLFGDRWPFSSPERFAEVKEALSRLRFVPVSINLFCAESMGKLVKVLQDNEAGIHIINLSNIFDYLAEFKSNTLYKDTGSDLQILKPCHFFRQLPVDPEALVHTSRIIRPPLGSAVTQPEEHWEFLDRMLILDICNEHQLTGSFAAKVATLIRRSSKQNCFGKNLDDLKILLACANPSDMENLMAHQGKLYDIIEQSGLLDSRQSEVKDWMENAVLHYQGTRGSQRSR